VGGTVSILGQVASQDTNLQQATITCSDGINVTVMLPPGESFQTPVCHVIGNVESANSVRAFKISHLGDEMGEKKEIEI